ncbi:MAG: ROK family transcriptional regulator [Actinobacteria bacterium]|nr:ROK family transcriptional regulator [Actinomycetota bacterium]
MTIERLSAPSVVTLPGAARRVMLEVLLNGPLSRKEVAVRLGLDPGHVTRLTQSLIEEGLLNETDEPNAGSTGRPSRPLTVTPGGRHYVGVKLAPGALHAVVCDLSATIVAETYHELPDNDPETTVRILAEALREFDDLSPLALGVTLGAQVQHDWTVQVAPIVGWRQVDLGRLIETATGLPTIVTNDMIALTAAEHWFGSGRGLSSLAVLTIGAGVGYGLVSNGRIVTNADMGLGLIGHEAVSDRGQICPQGHRGCAMSVLTFSAIEAAASMALGHEISFDDVLELSTQGNAVACAVVDDAADAIGSLIQRIATLAMPERIVVSGEGVGLAELTWDRILQTVSARRPPDSTNLDVMLRRIEQREWARGAAVTAIQRSMGASVTDAAGS